MHASDRLLRARRSVDQRALATNVIREAMLCWNGNF